jgi:hypothetical protein
MKGHGNHEVSVLGTILGRMSMSKLPVVGD